MWNPYQVCGRGFPLPQTPAPPVGMTVYRSRGALVQTLDLAAEFFQLARSSRDGPPPRFSPGSDLNGAKAGGTGAALPG